MASTYNVPQMAMNYPASARRNTNALFIENDWIYKPCAQASPYFGLLTYQVGFTTYSGLVNTSSLEGCFLFDGQIIKDGYLFCGSPNVNTYGCINVVNVANKNTPVVTIASQQTTYMRTPSCGCVLGNYLYVGANGATNNYVSIWNITTPSNPTYVSSINFGAGVIYHVNTFNGYLYISVGAQVKEYDISNPTSPQNTYTWNAYSNVGSFLIENNYLYIMCIYDVFQIINISDKSTPITLSTTNMGSVILGRACIDSVKNFLFIADSYYGNGVLIYNIYNKSNPILINKINTGAIRAITLYDGLLYIGDDAASGGGWIRSYNLDYRSFSGNSTDDCKLTIFYKDTDVVFDTFNISAGDFSAEPIFVNDSYNIMAVSSGTGKAIAYGNVTPYLKYQ